MKAKYYNHHTKLGQDVLMWKHKVYWNIL